ncbi:MAG: DUF1824 family protein [Spirulinaceae cyanobacterium RM2_2_10]|nr:DUF1824 family protein [Spirulinaceae cyanobacterium SM2_1_0]NJO21190.1 DUF1824 family protein [Spirulinaceae cyanobacterium RM2_2_10]
MPEPDLQQARQLLDRFSCTETRTVESDAERQALRAALLAIAQASESENIGVCAANWLEGLQAVYEYLQALGYTKPAEISEASPPADAVYIKFNTARQTFFIDDYTGEYRGVLVACQSEDEVIAGVYGYFPLDLFSA